MKRTGRQKDIVTPEKKQEQRELLRLFSANIRKILKNTDLLADDLQEIRLRLSLIHISEPTRRS